jgi:SpoVK/Ycf46/Vps4 family AAA+-type ATPase
MVIRHDKITMMNNIETTLKDVLQQVSENPYDFIGRFKSSEIPKNDMEYLNLWINYQDLKSELISNSKNLLTYDSLTPDLIKFNATKYIEVLHQLDEILQGKTNLLIFEPRLEVYLAKFDKSERKMVRLVILSFCKFVLEDSKYNNLFEFCKKYDIDRNYILGLEMDHPLFLDGIFIISNDSLSEDSSFYSRDLIFEPAIYKLFANLPLTQKELLTIQNKSLLKLFGIECEQLPDLDDTADNPESSLVLDEIEDIESIDYEHLISDYEEDQIYTRDSSKLEKIIAKDDLPPYTDNLDYLCHEKEWIGRLVELKKHSLEDFSYSARNGVEQKVVLQSEIARYQEECKIRLEKSIADGFTPNLELISRKLKLSENEKKILKILVVSRSFPNDKRFSTFGFPEVKELLYLLSEDQREQIRNKKYFSLDSKLGRSNIIHVDLKDRLESDIYSAEVKLDAKLISFFRGEKDDISHYIEYSKFENPEEDIDRVILPEELKKVLEEEILNHDYLIQKSNDFGFSDRSLGYGNASVYLFVGPSGTGKTMLAYAIAKRLGKRILTFDFNNNEKSSAYLTSDYVFRTLFREARINDAILFFDEAEVLLENRFNDLLIEILKHKGIVIFATNMEFRYTEAMQTRMPKVLKFSVPGPPLRKKIWQNNIPAKVKIGDDVDLEKLAYKYELTGRSIRHAAHFAFSYAAIECKPNDPIIQMKHFELAARKQHQNKLFLSQSKDDRVPRFGIDELVVEDRVLKSLEEIISIDKAKKTYNGEWQLDKKFPMSNGISILFYGPSGTGKSMSAEAIAYEAGKNIMKVNYDKILNQYVGNTEKKLADLFRDVATQDDVLLFDEADALFTQRTSVQTSQDKYSNITTNLLLQLIEENNVFAILTTNFIENIDESFLGRFRYIVNFNAPNVELRRKLWLKLRPPLLPIAEDVNFAYLAERFELVGREISQAYIKAASKAALKSEDKKRVEMDDFIASCEEAKSSFSYGPSHKIGFSNHKK